MLCPKYGLQTTQSVLKCAKKPKIQQKQQLDVSKKEPLVIIGAGFYRPGVKE